jgi:hypothetical protein
MIHCMKIILFMKYLYSPLKRIYQSHDRFPETKSLFHLCVMLYQSTPCGWPPLKQPYSSFGVATHRVGSLQPSRFMVEPFTLHCHANTQQVEQKI